VAAPPPHPLFFTAAWRCSLLLLLLLQCML
jgi:hypothetical protein